MTAWMIYLTVFTLLVVVSLVVMEQRQRRYMWIAALLLFGAQPAVFLSVPIVHLIRERVDAYHADAGVQTTGTTFLVRVPPAVMPPIAGIALPAVPASVAVDRIATRIALISPLVMLAILLLEMIRTSRVRRRWRRATIDGVALLVSADFGPAVVGFFRPAIVVPEWVLGLSPSERALLLAHEGEHLLSRDSRWLVMAYGVAALAPWNVGLLWMVRRFRLALEMDCDDRVLARGHDRAAYATFLLDMARRSHQHPTLAAGTTGGRSVLRARISTILSPSRSIVRDMSRAIIGIALLSGACFLAPSHPIPVASTAATSDEVDQHAAPRYTADSIVTDELHLVAARAAQRLPAAFRIDSQPTLTSADNGCPSLLVDGSVHLQLAASTTPRPGTTAQAHAGYYWVSPAGTYGVNAGEFLRVTCDRGDRGGLRAAAYGVLDATHRVAIAMRFNLVIDTLERVGSRLNIAYGDSVVMPPRNRARDVARFAWRLAGADTMRIDTVTVNVALSHPQPALPGVTSMRWYFYRHGDLSGN